MTIVRIVVGVVAAIVLLGAGCTVLLGSASHDALPAGGAGPAVGSIRVELVA